MGGEEMSRNASTTAGAAWGCCGTCMWFLNPRASLCADQKDPAHKCGIGEEEGEERESGIVAALHIGLDSFFPR